VEECESDTKTNKAIEIFSELKEFVNNLNSLPYTQFNMNEWDILICATYSKLNEFKGELQQINVEGVDVNPLLKALDEILF
jgi:hypothetical protein